MVWLAALMAYAESHPIVILRFSDDEWESLHESKRGVNEFTVARPNGDVKGLKVPAPCLVIGEVRRKQQVCFGLLSSKSRITTLESRIKVSRAVLVSPASDAGLSALVTEVPHAKNFHARLTSAHSTTLLSPKLSSHLVGRLASIDANRGGLRAVAESLLGQRRFRGNNAIQEDAVQTAMTAFGLSSGEQAWKINLVEGKETALARVAIMEDSVVEHDARRVPGYSLILSDVTGRAVFRKDGEQLEVFTANRRALEHCFGVDLIYINLTKQNVVMLQYKMLEPNNNAGGQTDWIYRPDTQLETEIGRMKAFAAAHPPGPREYRLNPQVFYLKFVKRDALLGSAGIIMPLDHFEKVRGDPSFKGPKNGLRLSFNSLSGRYMRQTPFLDLVKCGYVGAHAKTTASLQTLIKAVLDGNRAVVAAVQRRVET